jgi:2-dehydropantoate 2-reductase
MSATTPVSPPVLSEVSPYTVIGAGAIGGSLAVALLEAGVPVQVVDADPEHVAAIRADGLRVRSAAGDRVAHVPAFGLDDAPHGLGAVILAVKGQATGAAMAWVAPRLADTGWVVSMQNGLNEAEIASVIGASRTVAAFVDLFADVVAPGIVKDGGPGAMSLGEYAGRADSERVRRLADDLRLTGTPVVSPNVQGFLWAKLAFGSWSSVTALADAEMFELVDRHRPAMRGLATEVSAVALAEGIALEGFDAYDALAFVPGADAAAADRVIDACVVWLASQPKTRSGVWRDVAVRKRKTEVRAHFLPVVAAAERHGIPVPLVRELLTQIARIEDGEITHDEEHLARFDRLALAG